MSGLFACDLPRVNELTLLNRICFIYAVLPSKIGYSGALMHFLCLFYYD